MQDGKLMIYPVDTENSKHISDMVAEQNMRKIR